MSLTIVGPANLADFHQLAIIILLPDKSVLALVEDLVVVRLGDAHKLTVFDHSCHHLKEIMFSTLLKKNGETHPLMKLFGHGRFDAKALSKAESVAPNQKMSMIMFMMVSTTCSAPPPSLHR